MQRLIEPEPFSRFIIVTLLRCSLLFILPFQRSLQSQQQLPVFSFVSLLQPFLQQCPARTLPSEFLLLAVSFCSPPSNEWADKNEFRKLTNNLAFNWVHYLFIFNTFFDLSSNVLGNILGKSLMTTGSMNSINGIKRNTRNGTNLNISAAVRRN